MNVMFKVLALRYKGHVLIGETSAMQ